MSSRLHAFHFLVIRLLVGMLSISSVKLAKLGSHVCSHANGRARLTGSNHCKGLWPYLDLSTLVHLSMPEARLSLFYLPENSCARRAADASFMCQQDVCAKQTRALYGAYDWTSAREHHHDRIGSIAQQTVAALGWLSRPFECVLVALPRVASRNDSPSLSPHQYCVRCEQSKAMLAARAMIMRASARDTQISGDLLKI